LSPVEGAVEPLSGCGATRVRYTPVAYHARASGQAVAGAPD
jgi:hypothetical protein